MPKKEHHYHLNLKNLTMWPVHNMHFIKNPPIAQLKTQRRNMNKAQRMGLADSDEFYRVLHRSRGYSELYGRQFIQALVILRP